MTQDNQKMIFLVHFSCVSYIDFFERVVLIEYLRPNNPKWFKS